MNISPDAILKLNIYCLLRVKRGVRVLMSIIYVEIVKKNQVRLLWKVKNETKRYLVLPILYRSVINS